MSAAYRCWWRIVPQLAGAVIIALVGLFAILAGIALGLLDRIPFGVLLLLLAVFLAVRAWLTGSILVRPWGISAWAGLSAHRIAWSEIVRFRVTEDLSWYWQTRQRVMVVGRRGAQDIVLSEFTSFPWPYGFQQALDRPSLVDRTASALNERLSAFESGTN